MEISVGTVTGRTTATNRDGTRAARLLQTVITDERDVQTVQLVGQSGEESNPPNGSLVVVLAEGEAFKLAAATADAIIPVMDVGGKRIYSTDSTGETITAEVRLTPDGAVEITGANATITMAANGAINIANGASSMTMAADGTITFHGTYVHFECPIDAPNMLAM